MPALMKRLRSFSTLSSPTQQVIRLMPVSRAVAITCCAVSMLLESAFGVWMSSTASPSRSSCRILSRRS